MKKPLLIGISGGTGSGKTCFSKELISKIDTSSLICISQDAYYKDLSHLTFKERCQINFDNPKSIDFKELRSDLNKLIDHHEINLPIYDYTTHTRIKDSINIKSKAIIILEGIFALYDKKIRKLLDIKIFIDTPADIRVLRRVKRDINKRARSIESISKQYTETVRPMHEKYIEPTKSYADILVPDGGKNKIALKIINSELLPIIEDKINHANS